MRPHPRLFFLSAELARDAVQLRRFEQEARATSAISHPNILVVHDIGVQADIPYIVYELLEGETLARRLDSGALTMTGAVEFAEDSRFKRG